MPACRRALPLPRHARVVLFGDFLSPLHGDPGSDRPACRDPGQRSSAAGARSGGGTTCPIEGRVRFRGLEREADTLIPRVESVRSAYAERLAAQQEGLPRSARAAGFSFAIHRTDHPPETALLASIRRSPATLMSARWCSPRPGCCWRWPRCRCCGGCCGSRRRRRAARASRRSACSPACAPTEETPARTPWWLLAAAHARGRAGDRRRWPARCWMPGARLPGSGPVLLVIDNGWASAADWPRRDAGGRIGAGPRRSAPGGRSRCWPPRPAETGARAARHRGDAGRRPARPARRAAARALAGGPRRRQQYVPVLFASSFSSGPCWPRTPWPARRGPPRRAGSLPCTPIPARPRTPPSHRRRRRSAEPRSIVIAIPNRSPSLTHRAVPPQPSRQRLPDRY